MIRVSVLTPTYNRATYLPRLWNSLKKSTSKKFEWIIVDDGSTDNTAQVCEEMIAQEKEFLIRYAYQENHGKYVAYNRLVEMARGEYFIQIDDDDELLPDAIHNGLKAWDSIDESERGQYWCVCGQNVDGETRNCGEAWPENINQLSTEAAKKCAAKALYETCTFRRTEYQRKVLFPVIEGVKFIPETTLVEQLDEKYKRYYSSDNFIAYFQHSGNRLTNMGMSNERCLSDIKLYTYLLSGKYVRYRNFSRLRIRSEYALYKAMFGLRLNGYYTEPTLKLISKMTDISTIDKLVILLCWKSKKVRKVLSKIW